MRACVHTYVRTYLMRITAEQRVDRFQLKSPKGRDMGAPQLLGQTPVRTYVRTCNIITIK